MGRHPARGQRDDGRAAGAGSRLYPLIHHPDRWRHDQDAVDGAFGKKSGYAFEGEASLPRTGAGVDEHGRGRLENGFQSVLLPAAQGCGACGDRCEGLIFDDAFADALAPVAGDAEDLQVLQGGGAAGRPRDDVISLDQVPGNLAVALAALPVLEQPGGGDLRGGEVASRVEFRER